jgi:hypothetical protein
MTNKKMTTKNDDSMQGRDRARDRGGGGRDAVAERQCRLVMAGGVTGGKMGVRAPSFRSRRHPGHCRVLVSSTAATGGE